MNDIINEFLYIFGLFFTIENIVGGIIFSFVGVGLLFIFDYLDRRKKDKHVSSNI